MLPKGRKSVLDIGTYDGHFAILMTQYFERVVALDIHAPSFRHPKVASIAGDATALSFADRSFDCVFCTEVLEHIPRPEQACREIARVAKYEILVGTPFRQDLRSGRTTCQACGRTNPPTGHVNTFDERKLTHLFPGYRVAAKSFVGTNREVTNRVSTFLMDCAGNPWGTYDQDEPCGHCGAKLVPPSSKRTWNSRLCSALAVRMNLAQRAFARPHGQWIHLLFTRE